MLAGKLLSPCYCWLNDRSLFNPKNDVYPRPLDIEDAWYRIMDRAALAMISQRVGSVLQLGVAWRLAWKRDCSANQPARKAGSTVS